MNRFAAGVLVAAACVSWNARAQVAPACLKPAQVTNLVTPVELWHDIAACVEKEDYDAAVFLYAAAGAFARFDTLRVADKTAHQAAKALPIVAFAAMQPMRADALKARLSQVLGNDAVRPKYCADVERLGAPGYFPVYMVDSGLDATASPNQPQLVPGFDAKPAWPQAVKEYLLCPP